MWYIALFQVVPAVPYLERKLLSTGQGHQQSRRPMLKTRCLCVWTAWLVTCVAYSTACAADDEVSRRKSALRTWVDSSGKHQVKAELLSQRDNSVRLRRADGKTIDVPIVLLSRRDQRYVQDLGENRTPPIRRALDALSNGVQAASDTINGQGSSDVRASDTRGQLEELVGPEQPLPADIVYVQVSRELVRRLLARPVSRARSVNDRIVGRPVTGTANMTGQVNLGFVPSHDRAIIDVTLNGQIHSQTIGHGGPVQVHSGGITNFNAVKRVMFDHRGIEVLPAQVNAQTTTSIQGVSSSFRGLIGRIARRIGTRRAYELKPAAEAESAQKAEARIAADFDAQVWRDLWQGRSQVSYFARQLPIQPRDLHGQVWFATSHNYLQIAIVRGEGRLAPSAPPDPGELDRPDVVVHVHSSLVNRVIRDDELRQAIKPLVDLFFANEARQYVSSLAAANQVQVDLKQTRDGAWWTVTVRAPERIFVPATGIAGYSR
jgi:SLA1 Homology Domain 1 (SHD1) protein